MIRQSAIAKPPTVPFLEFFVPGPPQGKARARSAVMQRKDGSVVRSEGGRAIIRHYTPKETVAYESGVAWRCRSAMDTRSPASGPVALVLDIRMPVPAGWPSWRREAAMSGLIRPTTKPDADNIEKAIKDGMNGLAYVDDCQVVECRKMKRYHEHPGVQVTLITLDALPASTATKREISAFASRNLFIK